MARVIVVVARDRPVLFSYFDTVFAGMPDIKVLIDRRAAWMRSGASTGTSTTSYSDGASS